MAAVVVVASTLARAKISKLRRSKTKSRREAMGVTLKKGRGVPGYVEKKGAGGV